MLRATVIHFVELRKMRLLANQEKRLMHWARTCRQNRATPAKGVLQMERWRRFTMGFLVLLYLFQRKLRA